MRPTLIVLSIVALFAVSVPLARAQEHQHASFPQPTSAAPARGYATDATLRQQMRAVRAEMTAIAGAQQHHGTAPEAAAAAARITEHVNTIIVECKLPADADEALHAIIGPMLQNAATLQSDPMNAAAVAALGQQLARYGREFDDPGFAAQSK